MQGTARAGATAVAPAVRPSMARFVGVAAGQLVSITGSALTEFAVPIWIYTRTGSLADFGLLWALALLCRACSRCRWPGPWSTGPTGAG